MQHALHSFYLSVIFECWSFFSRIVRTVPRMDASLVPGSVSRLVMPKEEKRDVLACSDLL
jgi:hypothetical protein